MLVLSVSINLQARDSNATSVLCSAIFAVVDNFDLAVSRLRLISDRFQNAISVMKVNHVLAHAQGGLSTDVCSSFPVFY